MSEIMKILIADDSSEKISVIVKVLKELPEFESLEIDYELDLTGAKYRLSQQFYDLLVLDLNMPVELGDIPNMTAGIDFVDEITLTEKVKKPLDIMVLSAFDSSVKHFKEQVEKSGFVAMHFDETSRAWRDVLLSKVCHLLQCKSQRKYVPRIPKCDVLLITAVAIETSAILACEYNWKELSVENDPTPYRYVNIEVCGVSRSIVHVQLSEMGMTAASAMVTKAIMNFSPQYIVMPGIAAGVDKDVGVGDILVATEVWDYGGGKYEEKIETGVKKVTLSPDPKYISIEKAISDRLEFLDYTEILKKIKDTYAGIPAKHDLKVHFGKLACGPAVVASAEIVAEQVKAHARKTLGIDMESYGVYYAARATTRSNVIPIVVKSVCDFADKNKDDKNQDYAAYTSAQFVRYLIECVLEYN